jgi:ComEC/Rec2-related protein
MAWRIAGLALGLIAGIFIAAQDVVISPVILWITTVLGATGTAASLLAERKWTSWPKSAVAAVAVACALPLGYYRTMDVIGPPAEGSLQEVLADLASGTRIAVRGHISAEPELRGKGQLDLYLRVHSIRIGSGEAAEWLPVNQGQVLVRAYENKEQPSDHFKELASPSAYGWELEVSASYRPIEPSLNPSTFDYAKFLQQSGVDTRLRVPVTERPADTDDMPPIRRPLVLARERGHPMMALALAAKSSFLETFKSTIRAPASRLTAAATLGARRSVEQVNYRDRDLATTMRHAGVGHVLAVSGLHVSVIAVMMFALFRMTGAKPRTFVPVLILFLILFALLTGARPSSVRAVIMNSVVLIALAYLRSDFRTATVIGLSLSSAFILLRNPTVLFAPSFLLSYGAVLSLIVIAPPLDRLLCKLRGYSLLFAACWFVLLLRLAGWHLEWLLHPPNLIAYLGVLWLLISAGTKLNHLHPFMASLSLQSVPTLVRLFFAAQLAIQFGMMIPMSAWFFGLFPVAGVLVNLFAIPAVGVLVQLGMLTGLVGMLPVVGEWVAIPFGAAATLTGDAFIGLSHLGASVFPFPATPKPTPYWMTFYYVSLGILLLMEGKRTWFLGWLYRWVPPGPAHASRHLVLIIPLGMVLFPLLYRGPAEAEITDVRVLSDGRYPVVVLNSPRHITLINSGDRFSGGRLIFDSVRDRGATRVNTVILPSSEAAAGIEGARELLLRLPVDRILLPVLPAPDQSMPEAIGDDYVAGEAEKGASWAVSIVQAFEDLRASAADQGTELIAMSGDTLPRWSNASLRLLPRLSSPPNFYRSRAVTPVLQLDLHGLRWLIITETTPVALRHALRDVTCDVLVVRNLNTFRSDRIPPSEWMLEALSLIDPRLIILAGDNTTSQSNLAEWVPVKEHQILLESAREGAITAHLLRNGETEFRTYITERRFRLAPLPSVAD